MSNKKLCIITTISKTMDWFVCPAAKYLSENGYDITLISNMEDGFAERNEYAKCISLPMNRGIQAKDVIPTIKKLTRVFKEEKFDIVQYTTPNAAFYSSIASSIAKVPIRLYGQWGIRYVAMSGISKKVFKLIEKTTCRLSTDIREVSQKNRQIAIDEKLCPASKISVIGKGGTIGVDLKQCDSFDHDLVKKELREKYNIPQDAFVYGYVGRINADKGINELIEAFKSVLKEHKNVYLTLVGMLDDTNPISDENLKYAKDSENIVLTGNVPPNEVYKHMAVFNILVHPTYREGFSKVLQEAMGMRLPIITTDVPGPSEVIEKDVSAWLIKSHSVIELKNQMEYALEHPKECFDLSNNARAQAEKYYERSIMLKNILQDMDNLVKNHR